MVSNRRALPNRRPPPFLDVKQSIYMYLGDAKMENRVDATIISRYGTQANVIRKYQLLVGQPNCYW